MHTRSSYNDKMTSSRSAKSDDIIMTDTASIKGLPIEPAYALLTESSDVDAFADTNLSCAYAITGPVKVR